MKMKKFCTMIVFMAMFSLASCVFAAESSVGMTEVQQKIMDEGVTSAESSFRQMYRQVWSEQKLDEKIKPAVSNAMAAQLDQMMWGTRRFRLSYNISNVIGEIVKNSVAALQPDLDILAVELSKKYNAIYPEDAVRFFKNLAADGVVASDNPVVKAVVKRASADMIANGGAKLKKKVTASLPEGVKITEGFEAKPTIQAKGFKDSSLTFIDVFSSVSSKVESDVVEAIKDYFVKEVPGIMWDNAVNDVKKGFFSLYDELKAILDDASEMANTPEAQKLIQKHELDNSGD